MSELLHEFRDPHRSSDGTLYRVAAVGRERPGGTWEGWLEFTPLPGGVPLVTPRETSQPNRKAAVYWAHGLEPIYFDGALERALRAALGEGVPAPPEPLGHGLTPGR